jgi:hypothetical protein
MKNENTQKSDRLKKRKGLRHAEKVHRPERTD